MGAIDDIYQDRLLANAGDITRNRRLENPDASATVFSRSCGSALTVDINMLDGVITDYGQAVEACVLGSASASIFAKVVVGKTREEVVAVRAAMQSMLKKNGPPPKDEWAELALLEPARAFTNRHQSILLPFDATVRAFGDANVAVSDQK